MSKATRRAIADTEKPVDSDSPIMVIGDKSKVQLSRVLAKNLAMSFNQIGRDIPTFADAAGVADLIVKSDVKYDGISIVYNKFVSAVAYESEIVEVVGENALKESGMDNMLPSLVVVVTHTFLAGFRAYEMEDDVTKDLAEFSLANAIYAALVEAHACEQSARYVDLVNFYVISFNIFGYSRNAMDNASKNAKDMIDRLTMQYNRGRQAAITNELVDIITGMLNFVPDTTHLLTMNVQVPAHCRQVPWLFYTYQIITPVYIDSETLGFFFCCEVACVRSILM